METIPSKFARVFEDPYGWLDEWKKASQRKVIGCFPMYAPEEIIHAAGMLPVTLLEGREPITLGDKHLMVNACEQVRSCFDMLLKGKFDCLDGVVFPQICDQIRFFADVWQLDHPFPFFHQIWMPPKQSNNGRSFLLYELNRFKSKLEKFAGKKVARGDLVASIRLYNKNRSLLRELYELRKEKPGVISSADLVRVVAAGLLMSKEEHNNFLSELLSKVKGLKPREYDGKIKLVAIGHPCAIPETEVLNMVEEMGGVILDDDFYVGRRYFATDVKLNGDPIESLADYHMSMSPCVTKHYPNQFLNVPQDVPSYSDYVVDLVGRNQAQGVVFLRVMYCDPYDFEFVMVKNRLSEMGVPFLSLVTEHGTGPLEPIRTRLQAFLEMLKERGD